MLRASAASWLTDVQPVEARGGRNASHCMDVIAAVRAHVEFKDECSSSHLRGGCKGLRGTSQRSWHGRPVGPQTKRPEFYGQAPENLHFAGTPWTQLFRTLGNRGPSSARASLDPTFREVESTFAPDSYMPLTERRSLSAAGNRYGSGAKVDSTSRKVGSNDAPAEEGPRFSRVRTSWVQGGPAKCKFSRAWP